MRCVTQKHDTDELKDTPAFTTAQWHISLLYVHISLLYVLISTLGFMVGQAIG